MSKRELLSNGDDAEFRSFIHHLRTFGQMLADVWARFGAYIGLTGPQFTLLMSISHRQGKAGVGVDVLAGQLNVSCTSVRDEAAKLMRAGLIRKRIDAKDRRRLLLSTSPAGDELLERLAKVQAPVNDAIFETLTPAEFRLIRQTIARLVPSAVHALTLLPDRG